MKNNSSTGICVIGAGGRMGRRVLQRAQLSDDVHITGALDAKQGHFEDIPIVTDVAKALQGAAVVIDFAAPPACCKVLPMCITEGAAYVLASTALSEDDERAIAQAAEHIPMIQAANFSVGVNVLLALAQRAGALLGEAFDVEISEIHHRFKRDAPSGTALALADAIAVARPELRQVLGRAGSEPERDKAQLGIAAMRGGDVSGEHTAYFFGNGERVELTHRATTPDIFADGALRAASWLKDKAPGRYDMQDVLGLR